jgi:hypothetical protein
MATAPSPPPGPARIRPGIIANGQFREAGHFERSHGWPSFHFSVYPRAEDCKHGDNRRNKNADGNENTGHAREAVEAGGPLLPSL